MNGMGIVSLFLFSFCGSHLDVKLNFTRMFPLLQVTVGNFSVEACPSGGSFLRVSATVDNVAKGAWGNALDITARLVQACEEAQKEE
jgi:hypothetical protein